MRTARSASRRVRSKLRWSAAISSTRPGWRARSSATRRRQQPGRQVGRGGEPHRAAHRPVPRVGVAGQRQHVLLDPLGQRRQLLAAGGAGPAERPALEERQLELLLQRRHAAGHGGAIDARAAGPPARGCRCGPWRGRSGGGPSRAPPRVPARGLGRAAHSGVGGPWLHLLYPRPRGHETGHGWGAAVAPPEEDVMARTSGIELRLDGWPSSSTWREGRGWRGAERGIGPARGAARAALRGALGARGGRLRGLGGGRARGPGGAAPGCERAGAGLLRLIGLLAGRARRVVEPLAAAPSRPADPEEPPCPSSTRSSSPR